MPVAPHVAAWGRRWPHQTIGPLAAAQAGSDFGGVPVQSVNILALWPAARIKVEIGFGADRAAGDNQWNLYDVTGDVMYADHAGVNISPIGRPNEAATAPPAGCKFRLLNTSGNYTAYLPTGVYYPYVERKPPVRVSFTLTGQAADAVILFEGFANGFVPSWDSTARLAIVNVSASGSTRRLGQGASPLDSPMRRSISTAGPVFYWPMEDESGATQIASGLSGGLPLMPNGTISYASSTDLPGAKQALTLDTTTDITHDGTAAFGGKWQVDWYTKLPQAGFAAETILIRVFGSGTVDHWDFVVGPGYQAVHGFAAGGVMTFDSGHLANPSWFLGQWIHLRFMFQNNGSNVDGRLVEFPLSGAGGFIVLDHVGVAGNYTGHIIGAREGADLTGVSMSHLAVYAKYNFSATDSSANGYSGETATTRIQRLCNENGLPLAITGPTNTRMGAQSIDTLLNLLRECEAADHGSLYDGLGAGIGFVHRQAIYNQAAALTVDAAAGQFTPPLAPIDDDQRTRNKVTVTRKGGSSATYEDATGPRGTAAIGVYDESKTLNVETDADPLQHAGWEVRLGTVEGFRYPTLALDFNTAPGLLADWLRMRLLNRVDVTNVASIATQHPTATISVVAEGWSVSLSPFVFTVTMSCSPYAPHVVGVMDTSGFLDCAASRLAAPVDAAATTLNLVIADECTWTHADGDYNITVDGEDMTVTAVGAASGSGSSWTQALTVTRSVNGAVRGHGAGAEVHIANSHAFVPVL